MNVVVLAAGQGTRMHSDLPKVLHRLAGKPLLGWVLEAARSLAPSRLVVVYGHAGDRVRQALDAPDLQWVEQRPQRGTGHAVMQALPLLDPGVPTLVLYGDVPLVRPETLKRLRVASQNGPQGKPGERLALLTAWVDDPTGYGRIVRAASPSGPTDGEVPSVGRHRGEEADGAITRIVEERDAADPRLRAIREINTGMLLAPTVALGRWLDALSPANAQGEYYLTDIVAMAVAEGMAVGSAQPGALWETLGINNRVQLAELERHWQQCVAVTLMRAGVSLADPGRIDIRGDLCCGRDVEIDINCIFEGRVVLGDRVRIGAACVLRDCEIASDTEVLPFSHLEGARIGQAARIGPYARLRPGTELADQVHIGNFVEVKNSRVGPDSKANHLAYVGDAEVGARVNIGAGTITCNYDGAHKHPTVIEDDVFIGSDTQLVAPVRVGQGATLGAGTTLTRDAPPGQLTVSRARQVSLRGWKRPRKGS